MSNVAKRRSLLPTQYFPTKGGGTGAQQRFARIPRTMEALSW